MLNGDGRENEKLKMRVGGKERSKTIATDLLSIVQSTPPPTSNTPDAHLNRNRQLLDLEEEKG